MKKIIILIIAMMLSMTSYAQRPPYRPIHIGKEYTSNYELRAGSSDAAPLPNMGSPKVPVILVQFPDCKFSCDTLIDKTIEHSDENVHSYFDKFCNGTDNPDEDYMATIGSVGSVRDYFEKQSSGKFSPEFDIIGPITLPKSYRYYGEDFNTEDSLLYEFFETALRLSIESGIDMNQFDNNEDGITDFAFFIYAGDGQNYYDKDDKEHSYLIWPMEISVKTTIIVNNEGNSKEYTFAGLGCTNETILGEHPTIGTMCHELSHGLGLPDFYDTSYNNGFGLDYWSLMDIGNNCFEGKCPAGYNTYELDFMKWRELKTLPLTGKQTITLEPVSKGGIGYKLVNPCNNDEYYILENRQCDKYDRYLGWINDTLRTKYGANSGLLITHIDYDKDAWESRNINSDYNHPRFTILAADDELISSLKGYDYDYYMSIRGDLYPGINNITSVPYKKFGLYTGNYLPIEITKIVENEDGTITVELQQVEETEIPVIKNFQRNMDLLLKYNGTTQLYDDYLTIYDEEDLNITVEFIAKGVKLNYVAETELFTTILPYDTPLDDVNADVYIFSGFDGKNLHFSKQNTSENSDGVMKANTPYLLKNGEYGTPYNWMLNTKIKTNTSPEDYVVNVGEATHFGTYKTQHYYCGEEAEDSDYYYDYYAYIDNRFYRVLDLTVPAMHTGIRLKKKKGTGDRLKSASDESYGLVLHDGEYTTLVSPKSDKTTDGKVNVYDATGRAIRLNVEEGESIERLKEGIYFVNDKKVIVK